MFSLKQAQQLDAQDPLKKYRDLFFIPENKKNQLIYFCGNSLGLQPKKAKEYFDEELKDWATLGVEGHFQGKNPWVSYHKLFAPALAKIVGAEPLEVVAMNSLTTNLHLMLTSFYKPTAKRYKIITEANNFSSDIYALTSQAKLHGKNPSKTIVELKPRKGEYTLHTEDILKAIEKHKDSLALVMMSGVNYYTGQAFEMEAITKAARKVGAKVGFDLAHAVGNIPLELHKWNVDFAVWCTYKYLNSGPGAVGGLFVHKRHAKDKNLQRLSGWWGHEEKDRFLMKPVFKPMAGAQGWQQSNAPIFNMIAHKASLEIFQEAGMKALVRKSRFMVKLLEELIKMSCQAEGGYKIKIITPASIDERGCQLSVLVQKNGEELFDLLTKKGFITDWRSPNVIRISPVPLYNTYVEIFKLVSFLSKVCVYDRKK